MKEIKERLKVLAALCIDKDLNFDCGDYGDSKIFTVYKNSDKGIEYISGISDVVAEWKDSSIELINKVIAKVEAL